jgi:hypothetical protein
MELDLAQIREDLDGIMRTLGALQEGVGAEAVAVYDMDLFRLHVTSGPSPEAFWESVRSLHCLKVDWPQWYRELGWQKHLRADCACDRRDAVHGLLIHNRWALLVVARGPLQPGAEGAMFSYALMLSRLLPAVRLRRVRRGGRGPEHTRVGATLRWVLRMQCERRSRPGPKSFPGRASARGRDGAPALVAAR